MGGQPNLLRILKYVLTALLAAWVYIYGWAAEVKPSAPGTERPWYVLAILWFHFIAPIVLACAIVLLDVVIELRTSQSKALLKKFLDRLHARHFPYPEGGSDPACRVTLFAPGRLRVRSLVLQARSGGLHHKAGICWSIKQSEAERYHGIAGYAWATGIFVNITGLPDYDNGSDQEKVDYLRRTFVTEKELAKLHWRARSYCSLVVRNPQGDKLGVLMVESKLPDGLNHITAAVLTEAAEQLQFLLGQ
jgi:hypothetical protein